MIPTRAGAALSLAFAIFILDAFTVPARAHDFWIQPARYRTLPGVPVPVLLEVGHGSARQRSPIPADRITRFDAIGPDRTNIDLRGALHLGGASEDGRVALRTPGTYLLVLQTDARAHSLLPAIRFNAYLKAEGLTPALFQREQTHRMDVDGSEHYSRQAKAIVQVGSSAGSGHAAVTEPVGLPLEIVPEIDPYADARAQTLPVRVLYAGRPLAGALVKLTCLEHDAAPVEVHRTDPQGRARFVMPGKGDWLLNVVWTRLAPASSDTDFETTFSSLSFGFGDTAELRPRRLTSTP